MTSKSQRERRRRNAQAKDEQTQLKLVRLEQDKNELFLDEFEKPFESDGEVKPSTSSSRRRRRRRVRVESEPPKSRVPLPMTVSKICPKAPCFFVKVSPDEPFTRISLSYDFTGDGSVLFVDPSYFIVEKLVDFIKEVVSVKSARRYVVFSKSVPEETQTELHKLWDRCRIEAGVGSFLL